MIEAIISGINKQNLGKYRNIVLKQNQDFASQVLEENTKYIVRYTFDLGGKSVSIPNNCLIEFDGGSIQNGELITNGVKFVNLYGYQTLDNIGLIGDYKILTLSNADITGIFQEKITQYSKLNADYVDDSTSINKFVSVTEKNYWNNKQNLIDDLAIIRANALAGATHASTSETNPHGTTKEDLGLKEAAVRDVDSIISENSDNLPTSSAVIEYFKVINNITKITYSELKALYDSNSLIPGRQYQITDYVTTTSQENTISANHTFDIIVTANSANELNEIARAVQNDVYFKDSRLESWQIKYCIENNPYRFSWADTANGKGVIYYMKDEWGNECGYDFKNIQFLKGEIHLYTFSTSEGSDASLFGNVLSNSIKPYYQGSKQILNDNIIFNIEYCYNNTLESGCNKIYLEGNCYNNNFGKDCSYITFSKPNIKYIVVENGNRHLTINNSNSGEDNYYQNVRICQGVNNSSEERTILDTNVNQLSQTIYQPENTKIWTAIFENNVYQHTEDN